MAIFGRNRSKGDGIENFDIRNGREHSLDPNHPSNNLETDGADESHKIRSVPALRRSRDSFRRVDPVGVSRPTLDDEGVWPYENVEGPSPSTPGSQRSDRSGHGHETPVVGAGSTRSAPANLDGAGRPYEYYEVRDGSVHSTQSSPFPEGAFFDPIEGGLPTPPPRSANTSPEPSFEDGGYSDGEYLASSPVPSEIGELGRSAPGNEIEYAEVEGGEYSEVGDVEYAEVEDVESGVYVEVPDEVFSDGHTEVGDGTYAIANALERGSASAKDPKGHSYDDLGGASPGHSGEITYSGVDDSAYSVATYPEGKNQNGSVNSVAAPGRSGDIYSTPTNRSPSGSVGDTYAVASAVEHLSTSAVPTYKGDYDNLENGDPLEGPVALELGGDQENEDIYVGLEDFTGNGGGFNNQESPYERASPFYIPQVGDSSSDPKIEIVNTNGSEKNYSSSDRSFIRSAKGGPKGNRWKLENKNKGFVPEVDQDQPQKPIVESGASIAQPSEPNESLQDILKNRKSFKEEPKINGKGKWTTTFGGLSEEGSEGKSPIGENQANSWRNHLKKTPQSDRLYGVEALPEKGR